MWRAEYIFDSNTAAGDPGPGVIRMDTADELYVNPVDLYGDDYDGYISRMPTGFRVMLWSSETGNHYGYWTNFVVNDNTGWYTIVVVLRYDSRMLLPRGGNPGDSMIKQSADVYDAAWEPAVDGVNIGAAVGEIYKQKNTSNKLELRTLRGTNGIDITTGTGTVTIDGLNAGAQSPLTTRGDLWTIDQNGDFRLPLTPTPGQVLTSNDALGPGFPGIGWEDPPVQPVGDISFTYNYLAGNDPSLLQPGRYNTDSDTNSLITEIYVHKTAQASFDASRWWSEIRTDEAIVLWLQVGTNAAAVYDITGPSVFTDPYYTIPVTFRDDNALGSIAVDPQPTSLTIVGAPEAKIDQGGLVNQGLIKQSSANYDFQWADVLTNPLTAEVSAANFGIVNLGTVSLSTDGVIWTESSRATIGWYEFPAITQGYNYLAGVANLGVVMPSMVEWKGTHEVYEPGNPFGMGALFAANGVIQNATGEANNLSGFYTLQAGNTIRANGQALTHNGHSDIYINTTFDATGGGSLAITNAFGVSLSTAIGDGCTMDYSIGVSAVYPGLTGTGSYTKAAQFVSRTTSDGALPTGTTGQAGIWLTRAAAGTAPGMTGDWGIYQDAADTRTNQLTGVALTSLQGVGQRQIVVEADGTIGEGAVALNATDTTWLKELAEGLVKVAGSTVELAGWVTVHTIPVAVSDAIHGSFTFIAKRTDGVGFYKGERKFVAYEDGGVILDDAALFDVGATVPTVEARLNVNGTDLEFQVRSDTGDWDWNATIFNRDFP
jgi:hypothetical protein